MTTLNKSTGRALAVSGILALVILAAGAALAQGPGQGAGMGARKGAGKGEGFRLERLAAHLDLTAEQQEAIGSLHEQNRTQAIPLRKKMMRLRNELKGEMLKDSPSSKTVLSLNEKIGQLKTQLKANRLKTQLAVREQLTPEQRDQMLLMKDHGPRGDRRSHGHGAKGRDGRFGGRGMDRGQGQGYGQGDGTGPRAGSTCPKTEQ